jgi:hypothetical protein
LWSSPDQSLYYSLAKYMPFLYLIFAANLLFLSFVYRAGIFKHSMGARNRGGIGLSYRPAWLHRLAEFIPQNRFLGFINV